MEFNSKRLTYRIKSFLLLILESFNLIIPKKRNRIFFYSYPDFSDNPYFLYNYVSNKYNGKFDIVWGLKDTVLEGNIISKGTTVVQLYTLRYFYYLFTSKVLFFTHGLPPGSSGRQLIFYLGHFSVPLKIGKVSVKIKE